MDVQADMQAEAELAASHEQLASIEHMLALLDSNKQQQQQADADRDTLMSVRTQLLELIHLQTLAAAASATAASGSVESVDSTLESTLEGTLESNASSSSMNADQGRLDLQVGSLCCVLYNSNLLLATITAIEPTHATVLLLTPTTLATRPCADQETCAQQCGMSHGLDVGLDALYDAAELDIASTFKDANAAVLAKYAADGVYYPARIVLLRESDVVVEFDDYAGDLHPTPFEDILPLVRANAVDQADDAPKRARVSDDDEDNDEDGDDGGDDDDSDQDFTEAVRKQRQQSEKFGAWETHTRGIGSILLAKMGYTPGSGLGKEGRGIVDPVPVAILPPGRGLGHVEEAKARKRQRKKQKRSDEGNQGGDGASGSRGSSDVFAFMNATLNSGKADSGPDNASDFVLQKSGRELPGDAMPRKPASQTSKTARLKALHVQEELERVRASLARARQGLERNRGDPRMRRTYEDQIDAFTLRISQLSSEDSRHSTALQRDKLRKSMTKF